MQEGGRYVRRRLRLLAAVTLLSMILPLLFSSVSLHRSFVIVSDSMIPTLKLGDIVVTRPVEGEIADGTVIVFKSPLGGFQVHRVSSHLSTERGVYYVTKGDANNGTDSFLIPAGNTVGELSWVLRRWVSTS